MSEGFTLDTKPQINMWVLLSRRHQVQLHLKGLKVKGITTALKRDFGDHGRQVKDYIAPIEQAIAEAGGEVDYNLVSVHVLVSRMGMFFDRGVFPDMETASTPEHVQMFADGDLIVVLTTDEPREANNEIYIPQ